NKPYGIIFVTGPTGSGKSTTLYAGLSSVNAEDVKVITVEDPVEYQLKGVLQVQANPSIGLTFAATLRSMLRHDPDIIMVGEVRDSDTAQISVQAALTGHLVLSTLHTNDAASGVTRLLDMGIEPYLISSSVEAFIAQRLVRLLCPECKAAAEVDDVVLKAFGLPETLRGTTIYQPRGCKACRMSGYHGRTAIAEFLIMDEELRGLVVQRRTAGEIKSAAVRKGMKTLRQHGWERVKSGLTSAGEVLQATQ
ncbi:MAG: Flp pilus assembly complex ATPase component TadA, partial [Candidatus Omnitrophica bacterium]|nr:Flp pilus assembly complex ATPase component TadA [Candidatus Omnitrophota bacterium]